MIGPAAQAAHDPGTGAVGYPVYRSLLQQALEKLSWEVPWDLRHLDAEVADTRRVQLPPKFVGINNIWLYRGEACAPTVTTNVILKDNYSHGNDRGAFQNVNWNNVENGYVRSSGFTEPWNVHYAGIRGGELHLSPQCHGWDRIRVEYIGIGVDAFCPDEPLRVPLFARQALVDYVAMMALEHRIVTEGKEQLFTMRYKSKREECLSRGGSWENALMYWGQMDEKDKSDVARINASINRL